MTKESAKKQKVKTQTTLPEGTVEGTVVGENTVVTVNFVVRDGEGAVLDDMYERTPFKFIYGEGDLPPGLQEGIEGRRKGESDTIVVPAERAYGERRKDLIIRIPRSQLPSEECEVGSRYRRLNADGGSELFTVMGYLGDWVYLDRNHPWAGRQLVYEIRIVEVLPEFAPLPAEGDDKRE